ncbi:MAG: hypothetical protein NTY47_04650 [Candidatus Omnitrophica bacterium]|nr:hypothetical protein [Candidatus Omnitrophota bacterium]
MFKRDSRSNASKTWLRLILAARRGEKGLPQWVYNRWKVLEENKTKYETFFNLFEEFDKHAGDNTEYGNPDEYDLYAPGEIGKAVIAARKFSIRTSRPVAVFALGAGGFGSVCALVGVDQATAIEFANELGLPQMIDPDKQETKNPLANNSITVEEAEKDTKDGILRFWRAAKADREGGVLADGKADWSLGLAEWNEEVKRLTNGVTLQIDHELPWVLVNKDTLEVKQLDEVIDEQGAVKAEYPATEWLVLKNWDVDFDWKTYFRPDMLLISPKNKELVAERQKVEPGQKTLLEVFPQLLSWARANGKKIIFSAPVRWLDTLGSSWDLVDFRLMGTPEGDMCLELLPACNAIPSEYRVELTITPTDNPNTIEYKSAAFFGNLPDHTYSMDPSKVVRLDREAKEGEYEDSIILVPHPEKPGLMMLQRKERDLPAYFANLFGIKGGLRLELSQMSFVPRQGGMESSNIFTDLACLIMATLSGAKFSVAEISHISLMAQINECNNITGNQGADAAWAGAGLHYYLGGIKDSKSQRDFAAVAVDSGKAKQVPLPYWISHPAWGVNHSNVTNTVPHAIMLDQQAIKLNPEQLGVLDAAVEMLPSNVRELVSRNTLIFLNFTDNKTGHRSLGRDQIEIDTALLDKGRKNDLALRLWHEAVERQAIIDVLKDLGLIEAFNKTLLSPKERETTFVDIGGYQVVLSEVINNISAVVHQALETSQISGQYLRWPLAILKEGGKASDLSFISFNLVAFLTKRAVMDKVAYFRNINISKNDHERAAMRIYFMQVALKGTNISSGIVTMDLSDINEAFKPANNLMDIIAIGGLVVPENWPVGGTPEQARTAAGPANAPGGIDFRYIGIMTQFQKGDFKHSFEMPDLASLKAMDLVMEKQKLMQMISSGIQPSGKRVAEYVSACYVKNGAKQGLADAMACLTSLFKMEEENVIETDPELKSFLFFMESSDLS